MVDFSIIYLKFNQDCKMFKEFLMNIDIKKIIISNLKFKCLIQFMRKK